LSTLKCEITTKWLKIYQETYGNFSGFLQEILVRTGVQITRKRGANSKKEQKTQEKKAQNPDPADWYPSHTDPDQIWCLRGVR